MSNGGQIGWSPIVMLQIIKNLLYVWFVANPTCGCCFCAGLWWQLFSGKQQASEAEAPSQQTHGDLHWSHRVLDLSQLQPFSSDADLWLCQRMAQHLVTAGQFGQHRLWLFHLLAYISHFMTRKKIPVYHSVVRRCVETRLHACLACPHFQSEAEVGCVTRVGRRGTGLPKNVWVFSKRLATGNR